MLKFVGALVVASLIGVGLAFIIARVRFDRKPPERISKDPTVQQEYDQAVTPNKEEGEDQ